MVNKHFQKDWQFQENIRNKERDEIISGLEKRILSRIEINDMDSVEELRIVIGWIQDKEFKYCEEILKDM